MAAMKIALISFSTLPSLQRYLFNLSEALCERNNDLLIIGSEKLNGDVGERSVSERRLLVRTPEGPSISPGSMILLMRVFREISTSLLKFDPDVIHFVSGHPWNYFFMKLCGHRWRGRILNTIHDPQGHEGERSVRKVHVYIDSIVPLTDAAVVHSDHGYEEMVATTSGKLPIFKIPLGEMKWLPYRSVPGEKRVLLFGRIMRYKGVEFWRSIAEKVWKLDPAVRIVIAGRVNRDISRGLISSLKKCKNVDLRGDFIPENELDNYFFDSDLVMITHKSITQSGVILQAYRHSRPVVAFNVKGISEFIFDGKTGVLVDPFDVRRYAETIMDVLNDNKKLIRFSRQAWSRGGRIFSLDTMAERCLEAYEHMLGSFVS